MEATEVQVGDRAVRVSSPDKPYFPGLSKLDVVSYYATVATTMLPGLRERPTTLERWPDGVVAGAEAFYQKRIPKGAPSWVESVSIAFPSGRTADEVCPTEPAVIAWAANLGTITFHPWPVRRSDVDHPDELRLDFDPQPGTSYADAVAVALAARDLLAEHGMTAYPKTSGGRGVHAYVRIRPEWPFVDVRHAAIAVGRELERRLPGRVTTAWWKEERGERIFVDYNQNSRDRTIAAPWSVRARSAATVSMPLTWDELPTSDPERFTVATVPALLEERGDPWALIDDVEHDLSPLLAMWESDMADGHGEMPYPPDYPKMPGEPARVQPSRKAAGPV